MIVESNESILKLAFSPGYDWVSGTVLSLKSKNIRVLDDYFDANTDSISKLSVSVSTKLKLLSIAIRKFKLATNELMLEIDKLDPEKAKYISENGYAHMLEDKMLVFETIFFLDALVFELRSTYDIIEKLLKHVFRNCFQQSINHREIENLLKNRQRDHTWIRKLKDLRDLYIHDNTPWISIKIDSHGDRYLTIQKYAISNQNEPQDFMKVDEIFSIIDNFDGFLNFFVTLISKKAYEMISTS